MFQSTTIFNTADKVQVDTHPKKLELIENLLLAFHEANILYCHWKSNEHLGASMTGDTDLDILFDDNDKDKLVQILDNLDFKLFKSVPQKQYKDIEDFIGLDLPTGRIVHLHAHFKLTLGETFLKSYQPDFVDVILTSRIYVQQYGIYCIAPAFEYILLFVRQALKMRNRDILKIHFNNDVQYTGNLLNEYNWLKTKCSDEQVQKALEMLFKNNQQIYQVITGGFNPKQVLKLSYIIREELKANRRYSPINALLTRWYREVNLLMLAKFQKWFSIPVIKRRINPRGGLCIALIGADGSGKSTIIKHLCQTFEKKIDVYQIYFGKGSSGKKSNSRKLLLNIRSLLASNRSNSKKEKVQKANFSNKSALEKSFTKKVYECIEALLIADEKVKNIAKMKKLTRRGALVISDRFPQNQVMNINDGPVLQKYSSSSNFLLRSCSKLEAKKYAYAEANSPQVVFKLITDVQTSQFRKPNQTPQEVLKVKIDSFKVIRFDQTSKIIDVDARMPLDTVLYTVKKEIWKAMP